jgi:hypothetical protein
MSGDHITFHTKRAQAELDLAMRTENAAAARAHVGLSRLHLERLTQLIGDSPVASRGS